MLSAKWFNSKKQQQNKKFHNYDSFIGKVVKLHKYIGAFKYYISSLGGLGGSHEKLTFA